MNANADGTELERLRGHRVPGKLVENVPEIGHVWLRRLSAADASLITENDPESGLKTIALSLSDESGARLFTPANLDDGVDLVRDWTPEMIEAVNPALAELNGIDLDTQQSSLEQARQDLPRTPPGSSSADTPGNGAGCTPGSSQNA